ncbi:MAG: hypothetical protein SVU32_08200 [Candidatus Nanohaloarchaea archaeon]|nr:hypothetical protein [Candidatus Nanohaloarchaea archaeon]
MKQEYAATVRKVIKKTRPSSWEETLEQVESLDTLHDVMQDGRYTVEDLEAALPDTMFTDLFTPGSDTVTYQDGEAVLDENELQEYMLETLQEHDENTQQWFDRVAMYASAQPHQRDDGERRTVTGFLVDAVQDARGYMNVHTDVEEAGIKELVKMREDLEAQAGDIGYQAGQLRHVQDRLEEQVPDHVTDEYGDWDVVTRG